MTMLDMGALGDRRGLAQQLLANASEMLSEKLGRHVVFALCESLDDAPFEAMAALEASVYPEDIAYEPTDFREFLVEQDDALLALLTIDGELAGYVFGYAEDEDEQIVEGADYFVDDGVVALEWQAKGIGSICGVAMFALIGLLGYHVIGVTTEERDEAGRELVKWYHGLGFEDAVTHYCDDYAITLALDEERMAFMLAALGVTS